jgi:small subunit ribosomal protein S18
MTLAQNNSNNSRPSHFTKYQKFCPLTNKDGSGVTVDYKDIKLLKKFLTERGRILPSRITNLSAKKQREVKKAIKRARILGLLPFVNE